MAQVKTEPEGGTLTEQRGSVLRHRTGCPADPERVETYPVDRPENQGGGQAWVTRCKDCAAHLISDTRPEGY